jgi:hypothetical protein
LAILSPVAEQMVPVREDLISIFLEEQQLTTVVHITHLAFIRMKA